MFTRTFKIGALKLDWQHGDDDYEEDEGENSNDDEDDDNAS